MRIVHEVAEAVQALVGRWAEEIAGECRVIKRHRKFSGSSLAQTFVLGFLQNPNASDEDLAQMAGVVDVQVTPQAVGQRFSPELVEFLQTLFRRAVAVALRSRESLAPLLDRFTDVLLLDSTTISLPDELAELFPGCGGSHGSGKAALKLQVQLSLKTGALDAVRIEPGRDCDMKTPLQKEPLSPGVLRIADLGYFNTAVFQRYQETGVFWLSRLLCGTAVFDVEGRRLKLMSWLAAQGGLVDQPILLGAESRLRCRIIAWRVPPEIAARRRQKLKASHRRKGRTPSSERLAWCDWMILVTNLPADMLSPREACVLYRSRWQIELLFKRWKSQGLVAELSGSTTTRQMVRLWARLLAIIVGHWLMLTSVWGDARHSLKKACDAIRSFGTLLAATIHCTARLRETITSIVKSTRSTTRQNKRKRPSTFELLNNPDQLEFSLEFSLT